MPVNKIRHEVIRARGKCDDWFDACVDALKRGRFGNLRADDESYIIDADYKGLTIHGDIRLLITEERDVVEIEVLITAAVDNIYAAFRDPLQRIWNAFRQQLHEGPPNSGERGA